MHCLRTAGAGDFILRLHITAIAIGAVMIAGHALHSRRIYTAFFFAMDMNAGDYLLLAGFIALMGAGFPLHSLHIAAVHTAGMMWTAFLCQSAHRYIRQHHAQRQQERQQFLRVFHKSFPPWGKMGNFLLRFL